jgi:hypothetical protein
MGKKRKVKGKAGWLYAFEGPKRKVLLLTRKEMSHLSRATKRRQRERRGS